MDLIGSLTGTNDVRGITLNSQNIELFNIIESAQRREEAIERIYKYLDEILQADNYQKISRIVEEKTSSNIADKNKFGKFLNENKMQIRANWDSREALESLFEGQNVDSTYIDEILNIRKYFAYQTHGILTFLVDKDGNTINPESEDISVDKENSYRKVQALYDYVVGNLENGNQRFNRLTLDGQGKFGTVAGVMENETEAEAQPKDYNLVPLKQGYEFARTHN